MSFLDGLTQCSHSGNLAVTWGWHTQSMKTLKRLSVLTGLSVLMAFSGTANADIYTGRTKATRVVPSVQSAEEVVSSIPGIAKIPRSFVIGDGFKLKLTEKYLRIDHMGTNSRAPVTRRHCLLSFHFASPVAFFGSTVDLPIMNANHLRSRWGMSSLGDYVLQFSKDAPVESPTVGLRLTARF
jgi:hypothetical protein